jgi:hypothetical protein
MNEANLSVERMAASGSRPQGLSSVKSTFLGYTLSMDEQSTHQVEAQTDSANSRRSGPFSWFPWFILALVIYALSLGPVRKLEEEGVIRSAVPCTIYAPIDTFCIHHFPTPQRCYFAYLHLWHIHVVKLTGNRTFKFAPPPESERSKKISPSERIERMSGTEEAATSSFSSFINNANLQRALDCGSREPGDTSANQHSKP